METLRTHAASVPKSSRAYVSGHSAFLGVFRLGISKITFTPSGTEISQILNHVLQSYMPDHRFTSLVVNRCTNSQKHRDIKNADMESVIIAVGSFTGGDLEIWLDPSSETPTVVPIKNRFVSFFGARDFHKNSPWEGERWSIIWFCYKAALNRSYTPSEIQDLEQRGFNLPQEPPEQKHARVRHYSPNCPPTLHPLLVAVGRTSSTASSRSPAARGRTAASTRSAATPLGTLS